MKVELLEEYVESNFLEHTKSRMPRIKMAAKDGKLEMHSVHAKLKGKKMNLKFRNPTTLYDVQDRNEGGPRLVNGVKVDDLTSVPRTSTT